MDRMFDNTFTVEGNKVSVGNISEENICDKIMYLTPIVYTTRLEDMHILCNDMEYMDSKHVMDKILQESKPDFTKLSRHSSKKHHSNYDDVAHQNGTWDDKVTKKIWDKICKPCFVLLEDYRRDIDDYFNNAMCCWFQQELFISKINLKPEVKNFFRKAHMCNFDVCECCCNPAYNKNELLNVTDLQKDEECMLINKTYIMDTLNHSVMIDRDTQTNLTCFKSNTSNDKIKSHYGQGLRRNELLYSSENTNFYGNRTQRNIEMQSSLDIKNDFPVTSGSLIKLVQVQKPNIITSSSSGTNNTISKEQFTQSEQENNVSKYTVAAKYINILLDTSYYDNVLKIILDEISKCYSGTELEKISIILNYIVRRIHNVPIVIKNDGTVYAALNYPVTSLELKVLAIIVHYAQIEVNQMLSANVHTVMSNNLTPLQNLNLPQIIKFPSVATQSLTHNEKSEELKIKTASIGADIYKMLTKKIELNNKQYMHSSGTTTQKIQMPVNDNVALVTIDSDSDEDKIDDVADEVIVSSDANIQTSVPTNNYRQHVSSKIINTQNSSLSSKVKPCNMSSQHSGLMNKVANNPEIVKYKDILLHEFTQSLTHNEKSEELKIKIASISADKMLAKKIELNNKQYMHSSSITTQNIQKPVNNNVAYVTIDSDSDEDKIDDVIDEVIVSTDTNIQTSVPTNNYRQHVSSKIINTQNSSLSSRVNPCNMSSQHSKSTNKVGSNHETVKNKNLLLLELLSKPARPMNFSCRIESVKEHTTRTSATHSGSKNSTVQEPQQQQKTFCEYYSGEQNDCAASLQPTIKHVNISSGSDFYSAYTDPKKSVDFLESNLERRSINEKELTGKRKSETTNELCNTDVQSDFNVTPIITSIESLAFTTKQWNTSFDSDLPSAHTIKTSTSKRRRSITMKEPSREKIPNNKSPNDVFTCVDMHRDYTVTSINTSVDALQSINIQFNRNINSEFNIVKNKKNVTTSFQHQDIEDLLIYR